MKWLFGNMKPGIGTPNQSSFWKLPMHLASASTYLWTSTLKRCQTCYHWYLRWTSSWTLRSQAKKIRKASMTQIPLLWNSTTRLSAKNLLCGQGQGIWCRKPWMQGKNLIRKKNIWKRLQIWGLRLMRLSSIWWMIVWL